MTSDRVRLISSSRCSSTSEGVGFGKSQCDFNGVKDLRLEIMSSAKMPQRSTDRVEVAENAVAKGQSLLPIGLALSSD